jgi:hypothetical protein
VNKECWIRDPYSLKNQSKYCEVRNLDKGGGDDDDDDDNNNNNNNIYPNH